MPEYGKKVSRESAETIGAAGLTRRQPGKDDSTDTGVDGPRQVAQRRIAEDVGNSPRVLQQRARLEQLGLANTSEPAVAPRHNRTGLPDALKSGIEDLSGLSMDGVRVYYKSAQPAQRQALAYAQGKQIHLAPGQEAHLPHEAWHVVQQAQGRVRPTMQQRDGLAINDDAGLEREATEMGERALRHGPHNSHALQRMPVERTSPASAPMQFQESLEQKIQRILARRGIHIDADEASGYAVELTSHVENTPIPVKGRHRALKLNRAGVVSSVAWRPPSDASGMRISPINGPLPQDESDMVTDGPRPLTGAITTQDATISAASLHDIPQRASLGTVMGGSASQMSEIQNSEWLHLVAHSLGGEDLPHNIVAGPHSLNTAMIPFERFVRASARAGKVVDYAVTFFSDIEGSVPYVHHVEIRIDLPGDVSGTWTLEVSATHRDQFINGQALASIEETVAKFAS